VDILDRFGLTPAYSFAGAGSKLCLEKELYFCLESGYNFEGCKEGLSVRAFGFLARLLRIGFFDKV